MILPQPDAPAASERAAARRRLLERVLDDRLPDGPSGGLIEPRQTPPDRHLGTSRTETPRQLKLDASFDQPAPPTGAHEELRGAHAKRLRQLIAVGRAKQRARLATDPCCESDSQTDTHTNRTDAEYDRAIVLAASGEPTVLTDQAATVGEIFRRYGGRFLRECGRALDPQQHRVLQELALCRQPELGWYRWQCEKCDSLREIYNPCRSRHCPQCLGHLSRTWAAARQQDLLQLMYHHTVVTVPHEVNVLMHASRNHRAIYGLLFRATRDAIQDVARTESSLRATVGMLVVLHTWNQLMERHLHLHIALPAGGWSVDKPCTFVTTDDPEWIDSDVLMAAFRERVLDALEKARAKGELVFRERAAHLADDRRFDRWIERLQRKHWKGHVKESSLSPAKTLEYLAHYMNKVAISNSRIRQIDLQREEVTFTYRDNHSKKHDWGEIRPKTIGVMQFISRFLLHALPVQMSRCRAFGFWSSRNKGKDLPEIRRQLGQKGPPEVDDDAPAEPDEKRVVDEDFLRRKCSVCQELTMIAVEIVPKPTVYEMMKLKIWPEQIGYHESHDNHPPSKDPQIMLLDIGPLPRSGDTLSEAMEFS